MSLLLYSNTPPLSLPSFYSSSCSSPVRGPMATSAASRLRVKPIHLPTKSFAEVRFQNPILANNRIGVVLVVRAASSSSSAADNPADKEELVPVDKLPLESKLQERMEQKMKMKLAKKIRLRRKRLVRKRRMRKKGRWPPSKMKKLKNV